ncbi:hypothetical protein QJS66_11305 [Kocuria rhizophila]|nr:hypothetical protein QJS66_11305 [Kocuria rhizophila]
MSTQRPSPAVMRGRTDRAGRVGGLHLAAPVPAAPARPARTERRPPRGADAADGRAGGVVPAPELGARPAPGGTPKPGPDHTRRRGHRWRRSRELVDRSSRPWSRGSVQGGAGNGRAGDASTRWTPHRSRGGS